MRPEGLMQFSPNFRGLPWPWTVLGPQFQRASVQLLQINYICSTDQSTENFRLLVTARLLAALSATWHTHTHTHIHTYNLLHEDRLTRHNDNGLFTNLTLPLCHLFFSLSRNLNDKQQQWQPFDSDSDITERRDYRHNVDSCHVRTC
jgi:hypothetical protein